MMRSSMEMKRKVVLRRSSARETRVARRRGGRSTYSSMTKISIWFIRTLVLRSRRRRGCSEWLTRRVKRTRHRLNQIKTRLASRSRRMMMLNSSKVRLPTRVPESDLSPLRIVVAFRSPLISSIKSQFRDTRKSLVMLLPLMQRLSKTRELPPWRIEMLQ